MEWWVDLSAILRNLAIVAGGGFGLWLAWSRTRALNKQTETSATSAEQSRREHVAELFDSSVERLNHQEYWVRLGAVFVLEQVTEMQPELSETVVSVLTAYLRNELSESQEASDRPDILEIRRFLSSAVSTR